MACPVSGNFAQYQQRPVSPISTDNEKISYDHSTAPSSSGQLEKTEKPFVAGITNEQFYDPNWAPKHMQKVVSEAILLAGGGVAILLQVANPGVGYV